MNDVQLKVSIQSYGNNSQEVIEGRDYIKGEETVYFKSGENTTSVTLSILPDDDPEVNETILLRLHR